MKCPKCGKMNTSKVLESRYRTGGIYRRRECTICGYRFSTLEKVYRPKKRARKGPV